MDPAFKSQMDDLLNIAVENQERMNGIIKNMLLQARVQNSEATEIKLKQFIDTNFNILLKSKKKDSFINVTFENLLDADIIVPVFANDFGRLLLNLFENSLHSIEDKSKSCNDKSYKGLIKVSGSYNKDTITIDFYDNGKGIDKSFQDKIWEPFFTTKPSGSGTGLGLYLTYEIIKQHKGTINIESEQGKFARIKVELPLSKELLQNDEKEESLR